MGDEDEDKADQGYDAILDRDGDVGRVNMRIPFQLGLSVALDVLSDFIFLSRTLRRSRRRIRPTARANRNGT